MPAVQYPADDVRRKERQIDKLHKAFRDACGSCDVLVGLAHFDLFEPDMPERDISQKDLVSGGRRIRQDRSCFQTAPAMPVPDLTEWFAEWSRDTRGEQRGLLLVTAHRAKGLEFDHVVILDGGWDSISKGEDADAPRRLMYVAMTRARLSLAIMTLGAHRLINANGNAVLTRRVTPDLGALPDRPQKYLLPDLKLVDLSFEGRLRDGNPSLAAIASARVGDKVILVNDGRYWLIKDAKERTLARMSRAFSPPADLTFRRGEVGAVVRWRKADSTEEYQDLIKREAWEAVLPELVFG